MEQFTLYPHQKLSVEYHLKARYSLDGSEMGTGKTAVALEYIKRIGLSALVVCPAFLLTNWKREAHKLGVKEGLIQYIPYSKIHKVKIKEISSCKVWVADECFPAGTLVDTPLGGRAIETLSLGDLVYSAAGVDWVTGIVRNTTDAWVTINEIKCTPNHPMLTQRGWVIAKEVVIGDTLIKSTEAMRLVRDNVYASETAPRAFLRGVLLSEMADDTTGNPREGAQCRGCSQDLGGEQGAGAPRIVKMAHGKQLYEEPRDRSEGVGQSEAHWPQASSPRGEWEGSALRKDNDGFSWAGVGVQFCSRREQARLQSGLCTPSENASDRDRRRLAPIPEGEGEGCEEGCLLEGTRVRSIKIEECSGEGAYNLHIGRHPSYSVSGVLVHNCHFLKNPTAKRTHAFWAFFKEVAPDYFLGLSGTLVKNKVPDLWVPLAICSKNPLETNGLKLSGELLKYRAFSRYFCNAEILNVRGVRIEKFTGIKADKLPELRGLLVGKYRRVQLSEVAADLPSMTRQSFFTSVKPVAGLEEAFDIYMAGGGADPTSKALSALLKAEDTSTYAEALIDEGEAVVIFSDHVKSAQDIATRLGAPCVTGQMSSDKRSELVDQFQAGKIRVLVATIGSLSIGVTLTAARHVIFNDLSWCASDNDQAAARVLRIGQSRPCFSHYTIGSPTDEKITKVLMGKSLTAERILS